MKSYQSHKVVEAAVISGYSGSAVFVYEGDKDAVQVDVPENFFARGFPSSGDYLVRYNDGYLSWSPKAAFEEGYVELKTPENSALGEPAKPEGLSFGAAIEALKAGKRAARAGWNGKGMFLFLVPGSRFTVNRPPLLGIYDEGTEIEYHAHIDMKTAQGYVVPWLASQADVLADDWFYF